MKKFRVKNGNATFANMGKNNVLDKKKIVTIGFILEYITVKKEQNLGML